MRSEQEVNAAIDRYADTVRRLCMLHLKNYADTEDIFQTVFLKYALHTAPFADGEHEKAFILRAAVNACKDQLKSARRRRVVPILEAEAVPARPAEEAGLLEAVRALPRHYGAAVYLFYYEGYSLDEVASLCGCTPACARKRLSRGRKLLAKQLEVET